MYKIYLCLSVCFLLFCTSTPCLAKWGKADTALVVLRVVDWQQTRVIATETLPIDQQNFIDGSRYAWNETNPILGPHPTTDEVDQYFICLVAIDVLIALYGPNWLHHTWNGLWITEEIRCVGHNYRIGIRIRF